LEWVNICLLYHFELTAKWRLLLLLVLLLFIFVVSIVVVVVVVVDGLSGRAASKAQVVCCLRADYGKLMTSNST